MAGGTVTATWSGSYSRTPTSYTPGPPSMSPLAVPIANTAGQWLFAVVSWRQDAGIAGVLQYPSTVSVSDDAHNFWIPLQPGPQETGIVRCSIWMAPAARAADFVYVSPTSTEAGNAYQSAIDVLILEVTANCPWYSITSTASAFTNQGTSVTLSESPASGLFTIATLAVDNTSATVTPTATGWTATTTVTSNNGTDHSGDLKQLTWYRTASGSSMTVSATSATTMDWAEVMITVSGVADTLAFPYQMPSVENWPVLITEMATGPVLNANPVFLNGTANWTGTNASVAAVTWPAYQPWPNYQSLITPSLSVTPSGSTGDCFASSEAEPVVTWLRYSVLAWVWSVAGYSGGTVYARIAWLDSGHAFISNSTTPAVTILAGTWTQLTFASAVYPPSNAAYASVTVHETATSGNVPSSAVLYIGYAALGAGDSYENVPPDTIAWSDLSTRNMTQDDIKISRGIQYEQQSLEAGTMTVTLSNNDGAEMFGNLLSSYWPNAGDTDVPVRLRAIWPQSLTPYSVLFSGFTDHIDFEWDEKDGTLYGYAAIEASDAWSRLTTQMLTAAVEEVLEDGPEQFWTCSLSATNTAPGGTLPLTVQAAQAGAGASATTFTSTAIALPGNPGASCWQVSGVLTTTGYAGYRGQALTFFPPDGTLPPVSGGVTVEFWVSLVTATQPAGHLVLCACWGGNGPLWVLIVDNGAGASLKLIVYDKATGAGTTTTVDSLNYVSQPSLQWLMAVSFTQSSLTVSVNAGYKTSTVSCNLSAVITGFSWGGCASPVLGGVQTANGFMNGAFASIALTGTVIPPARIGAHFQTSLHTATGESDSWRIARILGYAGATPIVLGQRNLDISPSPFAGEDSVTGVTDTSSQVASAYFTNVAASTLAGMFTDGPGALIYRRRLEWYDRDDPQWVLGETAAYPLNSNGSFTNGTTGWAAQNSATLTTGSIANGGQAGPYFLSAGVLTGNGSVATPQTSYGAVGNPVTPGNWYTLSALVYCPQGWSSGIQMVLGYYTAGNVFVSSAGTSVVPLAAGSLTFLQIPAVQAPATAGLAALTLTAQGTPATSVQFYITDVVFTQAAPVTAGGAGATALEVPYLGTPKLSSDRALLFNQAQLTQYGTNLISRFSGTGVTFTPSSGVVVLISNLPSVNQRAGIPYTATLYLANTAQALPYYLNQPSMEDFGNWITQTLAAPLLRPETVTITPAATPQAMVMGLQAEVGDTATFRRRPQWGGAPETQVLTYVSKLTHDINVEGPKWDTQFELSPFPVGSVLICDDVIHGTLTGGNLFPW